MQKDSVINKNQRIAMLLTLAMTILVLLLHFPFDGYVTEVTSAVPSFTKCPKADLQTMRTMGVEEFNNALAACEEKVFITKLPISDWSSIGAPAYWFTSPIHALATTLSILLIGLAWFFSVRPTGTPAK